MHFLVNDRCYGFAVVSFRAKLLAEEDLFLMFTENHRSEAVAHAPFHDHLAKDAGDLLKISGSSAGDFIKNDLFSAAAAKSDAQLCEEVG